LIDPVRFDGGDGAIAHKDPGERPALAATRRAATAALLREAGSVTVAELEQRFGVSPMTARRDLADLERQGIARRTHGGAVLPAISGHEDSFATRVKTATEAKAALAEAAAAMVGTRESVFIDSSSTAYFVARRLLETGRPVTLITSSLPVMEMVAAAARPGVELVGVGGLLRPLTRSYVGPYAVHTVRGHFADRLFMSVKGLTAGGVLTDADPLEAEVKRTMIAQAEEAVLLVDRSKLASRGLSAIAPVTELHAVLAHGVPEDLLEPVRAAGVPVTVVGGAPRSGSAAA
jgi:DeoR/GlpR family transcriptional regulator of sugar metabolism